MITAYCLSYGNWTVIPKQWEESFSDMLECGFDAVALSFSESELVYARRAFEMQVNLAQKIGLEVYVVPSRFGGRFAGAPMMPSPWLTKNPDCQLPGVPRLACVESQKFREWAQSFIERIVIDYDIDGLIWDEAKLPHYISKHPDTIKRFGPEPTPEQMQDSFIEFVDELLKAAKSIRPDLVMTMFNMPGTPEYFTSNVIKLPDIDYAGYDGTFSHQSYFHEQAEILKPCLNDIWNRTEFECKAAGKKSFALVENMLMPEGVTEDYEERLDKYLSTTRPDHISFYYYGHNNECPEEVHQATVRQMKKHLL